MRLSRALVLCLVAAGVASAQSSRLVSELKTNYTAGGTTQSFQWYAYDAEGYLVYKAAYDGNDTLDPLMSTMQYTYDASNRLIGEANVTTDTVYEFRYSYDANDNLVEARRLNALGNPTLIDSMEYDGSNRLVRTERWNGPGTQLRYYHNLQLDGNGYVVSDTLYEPDGLGGFMATQAWLFTNATDGRVLEEAHWLDQSGWSQMDQTVLAYDGDDLLIARTMYEGNGASHTLLDSLAYTNDALGNRTVELHYDDERALTYRIDFTWETVTGVVARAMDIGRGLSVEYRGTALAVAGAAAGMTVELYDMEGRLVSTQSAPAGALTMPVYARPGSYVARVTAGEAREAVKFTVR